MGPGASRLSPWLPGPRQGQGSLRLRAATGAGSWTTPPRACLSRSAVARCARTRAWTPLSHTPPAPPNCSRDQLRPGAGSFHWVAAILLGSRDSAVTSAFRQEDTPLSRHAPARRLHCWPRPTKAPPPAACCRASRSTVWFGRSASRGEHLWTFWRPSGYLEPQSG